jgi:predicted nucleic acid-binding protein
MREPPVHEPLISRATLAEVPLTGLSTNDIWIAAAALENGGRLVAYDSHFENVPGLIVESP